ncbi:hypothetical protein cyc_08203 [Cyclospora cayetanensis]|uniref:Sulfhydryl oxidase n=1 Tax=Cyclospora cayetanensis TaxID=88456 RepID=A0A1D3D1K0_9EIME|nr:hypothetical protein cyc_08203 [Cyclospora cayetanensis]
MAPQYHATSIGNGTGRACSYFVFFWVCVLSLIAPESGVADIPVAVADVYSRALDNTGRIAVPTEGAELSSHAAKAPAVTAASDLHTVEVSGRPEVARSHSRMFASDPIIEELVLEEDYRRALEHANEANRAVIMMLYSAWCPHCFAYKKTFSRIAADLKDKFSFVAMNCMENEKTMDLCGDLGVFALPSIKLFVPASTYHTLPPEDRQVQPIDSSLGHIILELPGMRGGGILDSLGNEKTHNMCVHSLALPAEDIMPALLYAAKQTMQRIDKSNLRLTLEGDLASFEHLRDAPCNSVRWESEDHHQQARHVSSSPPSGMRGTGSDQQSTETLARARVHDAVRGLQFVLASWVVTVTERLTEADQLALIDLLEVARATIPITSVKRAAALSILHLYSSGNLGAESLRGGRSVKRALGRTSEDRFTDELRIYSELDHVLQAGKGLKAAEWRAWVGSVSFGKEAPPLAPLEEPKMRHCTTLTCSVWMLLHLLADGAAALAQQVAAHLKCGPQQVFYKRKGQALPVYLLLQQRSEGKAANTEEILDIASMNTEDLIDHYPSLGCMVVPSFDAAYTIYNFLRRFFGCTACRHHFRVLFSRRSFGLLELQPPEGDFSLTLPLVEPPKSLDSDSQGHSPLLARFRSQSEGQTEAWSGRFVEQRKLDHLKLWLWRMHNAVTVRTAADATLAFVKGDHEAKNYVNCDTRWPPKSACRECRMETLTPAGIVSVPVLVARDSDKDVLSIEEEYGDFDQAAILDYLKKSYWPTSPQNNY